GRRRGKGDALVEHLEARDRLGLAVVEDLEVLGLEALDRFSVLVHDVNRDLDDHDSRFFAHSGGVRLLGFLGGHRRWPEERHEDRPDNRDANQRAHRTPPEDTTGPARIGLSSRHGGRGASLWGRTGAYFASGVPAARSLAFARDDPARLR